MNLVKHKVEGRIQTYRPVAISDRAELWLQSYLSFPPNKLLKRNTYHLEIISVTRQAIDENDRGRPYPLKLKGPATLQLYYKSYLSLHRIEKRQ